MDSAIVREKIKTALLIIAGVVVVLGLVATIIAATRSTGAGVAYSLFQGLMETCVYAGIPAGLYAIMIGQDMAMRHQGVNIPKAQPKYQQGGYQQGGYQQGGYPQQPQQPYNNGQQPGNYQ